MLLTIIAAIILITGIILYKTLDNEFFGIFLIVFGCIFLGLFLIIVCVNHCTTDYCYEIAAYEKAVLEYRLANQDADIVGNELLYQEIVEFNNKLRETKRYAASIWTNWFNNAKIAAMDYIEIPGLNE